MVSKWWADHMNQFEKIFEKLARQDDASIIFTNWLDWVIDANLYTNKKYEIDFKGNEQEYYALYKAWISIVSDELERTGKYYYDYLGEFYEDIIQSRYKAGTRGQFFTPQDVGKLMAELCFSESSHDGFSYDCACGSGRLLLDAHEQNPSNILIGWDMDRQACKMAVLNLYISGARGSIICKDTLTLECYDAWRVNNYLGYGLSMPHIEKVSESDAYRFINGPNNSTVYDKIKVKKAPTPAPVVESKPKVNKGTLEAWL